VTTIPAREDYELLPHDVIALAIYHGVRAALDQWEDTGEAETDADEWRRAAEYSTKPEQHSVPARLRRLYCDEFATASSHTSELLAQGAIVAVLVAGPEPNLGDYLTGTDGELYRYELNLGAQALVMPCDWCDVELDAGEGPVFRPLSVVARTT